MDIVHYQRGDMDLLKRLADRLPPFHPLRYPQFVDYYYTSTPICRLLVFSDDKDTPLGVLGVEWMPFTTPEGNLTVGFGSNFHAFVSGAGGILFLHWMKSCDFGLVYGGG